LLEPCVGDGAILKAFQTYAGGGVWVSEWHISDKHLTEAMEYELRGLFGYDEAGLVLPALPIGNTYVGKGCYSQYRVADRHRIPTTVITNPPYSIAADLILHFRRTLPFAEIVMLLRLGFLESEERNSFYAEMGIPDLYILPNRPSFIKTESASTDKTSYAWFVWPGGGPRSTGRIVRLRHTPIHERLNQNEKQK